MDIAKVIFFKGNRPNGHWYFIFSPVAIAPPVMFKHPHTPMRYT